MAIQNIGAVINHVLFSKPESRGNEGNVTCQKSNSVKDAEATIANSTKVTGIANAKEITGNENLTGSSSFF